jgi:hypothetical protein
MGLRVSLLLPEPVRRVRPVLRLYDDGEGVPKNHLDSTTSKYRPRDAKGEGHVRRLLMEEERSEDYPLGYADEDEGDERRELELESELESELEDRAESEKAQDSGSEPSSGS